MDKQILKAFLIIIIFLIGYSYFISKQGIHSAPPLQENKKELILQQEKEAGLETAFEFDEKAEFSQEHLGEFIVTYSSYGGYVQKLDIPEYQETLSYENIGYIDKDKNKEYKTNIFKDSLIFTSSDGQKKEFIFDGYNIKLKFTLSPDSEILIFYNPLVSGMLEQRYQEIFYLKGSNLYRKGFKKINESSVNNVVFAGARDKYFCGSLVKGKYENIKWATNKKGVYLFLKPPYSEINLYVGPQVKKYLQPLGIEGVINYGFFHGIGIAMIQLLSFLHFVTKNWGISVIVFAVAIYFVLFPFTMKSTKAMKRMQDLQPEIEELRKKYKDNPQKMNKETMELYRKYKINPIGGCLPLFFQFPIFIALYQVLLRSVELKGVSFLWIKDLSLPDRAFSLPVSIPVLGSYINILPLLIIVINLIQQKFTTSASSAPEQKKMALFFAVFIGVIFYNFPSCLVLYWFVQNFLTLLYQIRISKSN